ncbi:MAG: hypothetical protein ACO1OQ_10610 [Rufibacter sp.]
MEYTAKNWILYILTFCALYAGEYFLMVSGQEEFFYLGLILLVPIGLLMIRVPLQRKEIQHDFNVWLLKPWAVYMAIILGPCLVEVYFIPYIAILLAPYFLFFTLGAFLLCVVFDQGSAKPRTRLQ